MAEDTGAGLAAAAGTADWFRDKLKENLTPPDNWDHDRSKTIGGSEIGGCARAVWHSKAEPEQWDGNGYTARGHAVESWFADPAGVFERLQSALIVAGHDAWFTATGDKQQTLIDEHYRASVTPDGFFYLDGETIYLEIKSIDPRVSLKGEPRRKHVTQVQWGLELAHRCGHSKPSRAWLVYINASDFADITVFDIPRDPIVGAELLKRATRIHRASKATDLQPEGLSAGGSECANCRLKSFCKEERAADIAALEPERKQLDQDLLESLDDMARARVTAMITEAEAKAEKERLADLIRVLLEDNNTAAVETPSFKIRYSVTKGRQTFDRAAAEADGLNLAPYMRTSNGAPRLTIKEKDE